MPESTTSVLLTITTPTPSSRSLISLTPIVTPIITGPIPVLSSGVRKGVEAPPTEVPVVLVTKPTLSTSTTTASYSYETAEPDKMKEYSPHPHDDLHANTEKALIAVGSVGTWTNVPRSAVPQTNSPKEPQSSYSSCFGLPGNASRCEAARVVPEPGGPDSRHLHRWISLNG